MHVRSSIFEGTNRSDGPSVDTAGALDQRRARFECDLDFLRRQSVVGPVMCAYPVGGEQCQRHLRAGEHVGTGARCSVERPRWCARCSSERCHWALSSFSRRAICGSEDYVDITQAWWRTCLAVRIAFGTFRRTSIGLAHSSESSLASRSYRAHTRDHASPFRNALGTHRRLSAVPLSSP